MTSSDAEQPTLDGLAPRRRRRRAPVDRVPASVDPVVQVVLDVQAVHLGGTFDYLIEESQSEAARPGVMVRVRFGGKAVDGVIWNRVASSDLPVSSLRYVERVLGAGPVVSDAMRTDITRIADAYGGTRANILRLAVPARVARIDREQRLSAASVWQGRRRFGDEVARSCAAAGEEFEASYAGAARLRSALAGGGFSAFVVDALPGAGRWARELAWMVTEALLAGRSAVVVLPTMREVQDAAYALQRHGLRPFSPDRAAHGGYSGDFAILSAAMSPPDRYRAYTAVAGGQVRCAIGTRSAMYAPVEGPALFVIFDDLAYQNMDGVMPYPNARGVLRLRARAHGGTFIAMAFARSPVSHWEAGGQGSQMSGRSVRDTPTGGYAMPIHALPAVTKEQSPWIRWLNRDELARLSDPTIGTRVPHTAVRVLSKALEQGPVLLSIPDDGVEALSCAHCHRQARCLRCTGPLRREREQRGTGVRCGWCGAAAVNWLCPKCGGDRLRPVRVGAAGTVQELGGLFRGVPVVVSSARGTRGVVESVECRPQIVVATPGCEPRVRPVPGNDGPQGYEYRAVAILDAWTSLYALGIDAFPDTLAAWMRAMSMCAPRTRGGQGLLIGETDPILAQAMMLWDSPSLASKELDERSQTGFPPVASAACVWGRRDAVATALGRIGVMSGGDWNGADDDGAPSSTVLGPVPIPQPSTINAQELESTADRVKAVVLVPPAKRAELAIRLRTASAKHVAAREGGELRLRLDPKDL